MTSTPAGSSPILFLNSRTFEKAQVVSMRPKPTPAPLSIGRVDMGDPMPAAIMSLCDQLGALVVLTDDDGKRDVRGALLGRGFRARYHSDGTIADGGDRGAGIAAWLRAHGNPVAVIIDRPGIVGPPGSIVVTVKETAEVTDRQCAQIAALVRERQDAARA